LSDQGARQENGLRIGSFAGAPIIIEPTFLFLGAYVLGSAVLDGGVEALRPAAIYLGALVVAVLVHEIGHAGVAQMLRIPSKRIVLTFFGGYVQFAFQPRTRWHEIAVSAAGPLANLATWFLLSFVAIENNGFGLFLSSLLFVSLILGILNLLPGFPLDGGHILRALLSYAMPRRTASFITACIGLALAIVITLWALWSQMWWTTLVGVLLGLAAWAEIQRSRAPPQEPPSTTSNA
jgi:Zn-dependent protease